MLNLQGECSILLLVDIDGVMTSAGEALMDTVLTCINRELGDHPITTGGQPGVMFSGSCPLRVSLNGGHYTSSWHIITCCQNGA